MDGWMDGWVGGWMGVKAVLRIAYSNQKQELTPCRFDFKVFSIYAKI
jgi:hypothetical protein